MRKNHTKRRLLVGLASFTFFIVATVNFDYLAKGIQSGDIFGFNIDGENAFSFFDRGVVNAASNTDYPYGNVSNQVILVNLKETGDNTTWLTNDNLTAATNLLNGESDSLKSYMNTISYGYVNVNSTLYRDDKKAGSAGDGFVPNNPRSYYITANGNQSEAQLEEALFNEIIAQFEADGSMATIPSTTLDTNGDQFVDNVTFLIRGNKDKTHNLLWPHQYALNADGKTSYPVLTTADGSLKVRDYNVIVSGDGSAEEAGIFNATNSDLGVIVHEYLHVYGLPDLYHNYKYDAGNDQFVALTPSEQNGDPLGQWDVMDNTITKYPQNPLVYTNKMYAPWGEDVPEFNTIETNQNQVQLRKVSYHTGTDSMATILKVDPSLNPLAEDEYFIVEYRKQEGWDSGLPDNGLIVYRINTVANKKNVPDRIKAFCDVSNNGNNCGNMFGIDEVYIFRPNAVLTPPSDAGNTDPNLTDATLSLESGRTTLGKPTTQQNAALDQTIYFSDGSNSGIVISNVSSSSGDTITFDVAMPELTEDTSKPTIGEPSGDGINGNWAKGSPALSVYVSDQGSGLESITVTTSDGEILNGNEKVQTYTSTYRAAEKIMNTNFIFKVSKNGTYTITATDQKGNVSEVKTILVENIDNTMPSIEVGKGTKDSTGLHLPITFTDLESNIDASSAFYKTVGIKDDTNNLTYDTPVLDNKITVSSDFQGKVCITVKDNAGNAAKDSSCWVISNDEVAPVIKLNSNENANTWTSKNITIQVTAEDKESSDTGINYMEITTTNGHIDADNERRLVKDYGMSGKAEEQFSFDVTSNGEYQIKVCDYANNCSEDKITVTKVDQSAPVITKINVKNEGSYALFKTSAHVITFEAHDEPISDNSGLKEIRYQLVGEKDTYEEDVTSSKWLSTSVDGIVNSDESFVGDIYAYVVDNAGNTSKVYIEEIARVSTSLPNPSFKEGIVDRTNKVNIIGLSDPLVTVTLQDINLADFEVKMSEDYLASHTLQNVYDISLMKEGSAYALNEEITVRLAMDSELLKDGSLTLIYLDADGNIQEVATTIGDGYLEFKTDTLRTYAAVTSTVVKDSDQDTVTPMLDEEGVNTGDTSILTTYSFGLLLSIAIISYMAYRRKSH